MNKIDILWDDIDEKIKLVVEFLWVNGFTTIASCQGGGEHSFDKPIVRLRSDNINDKEMFIDLVADCLRKHVSGFTISLKKFYNSAEDELPVYQFVEIEFWNQYILEEFNESYKLSRC